MRLPARTLQTRVGGVVAVGVNILFLDFLSQSLLLQFPLHGCQWGVSRFRAELPGYASRVGTPPGPVGLRAVLMHVRRAFAWLAGGGIGREKTRCFPPPFRREKTGSRRWGLVDPSARNLCVVVFCPREAWLHVSGGALRSSAMLRAICWWVRGPSGTGIANDSDSLSATAHGGAVVSPRAARLRPGGVGAAVVLFW